MMRLGEIFGAMRARLRRKAKAEAPADGTGARGRDGGALWAAWSWARPSLLGLAVGWTLAACLGVALDRAFPLEPGRRGATGTTGGRADAPTDGLDGFLAADPFHASPMKEPVVVEEAESDDVPVPTGRLATAVLRGTLPGVAAWMEDEGQLRLILVGTSFDAYVLDEVTYREAVFARGDEVVVRELLFGEASKTTAAAAPKAQPPTVAGVPMGDVVAPTDGQDGQIPAELVVSLVQDPFDELKKVRLRPREGDGESGLQIQWIQNDSILKRLGVQKGDVIRSVNGIPFTNMADIANSISSPMNSERFDVEVERGGAPTALRYVVR